MVEHRAKAESAMNQYCLAVALLFCVIVGWDTVLVVITYQIKIGFISHQKIPLSVAPIEPSSH